MVLGRGVVGYEATGKRVLRMRSAGSGVAAAATGESDEGPGRELVISVGQYGLAALGELPRVVRRSD
jgi:hypothetical protein